MLVPERMEILSRRQFLGHETYFNNRTNTIGEKSVVNLTDVGEIVNRIALRVFVVDSHFIVQDGVKSDVLEVGRGFHRAQVIAVGFSEVRMARLEFKACSQNGKRMRRSGEVDDNRFRCGFAPRPAVCGRAA